MKNIFNSISMYSKKKFLVNKYKKLMCYKKNKSLIFDIMRNDQIFPSKVCHFQYDHRFLFSREIGNIRTYREVRWQKFIKFRLSG